MASRRPGSPSAPPNAKRRRHSLTPISNPDTEIVASQERGEDRAQLRSQIRSPATTILTPTTAASPATPTTLVSSSHGAMHETELFDENIHETELSDEEYYEEEGEGEGEEEGGEDMGSFPESGRKFLSEAWKEFVPIVVGGVISQVKCKYCEREISAKRKSGTSSMRKHLRRCKLRNSRVVNNLRTAVMSPDGVALGNWSFDQEVSRLELARMIVLHELPFMIVEYDGFRKFVSSLNPAFKMMSRKTVKGICMKLFQEQKVALQDILKNSNSRVSLTMDMWTSNQTLGYVCITCHFIDMDWKLQKRIVKFSMMETPVPRADNFDILSVEDELS